MVEVLGTGITLQEIQYVLLFVFIAVAAVEIGMNPTLGFIPVMDKKVFGYPTCESDISAFGYSACFAPSLTEIQDAGKSFAVFGDPSKINDASAYTGACTSIDCFIRRASSLTTSIFSTIDELISRVVVSGNYIGISGGGGGGGGAGSGTQVNYNSLPVMVLNFLYVLLAFVLTSMWVLLKLLICISILWIPVSYVQRWYDFWFGLVPMY